MVSSDDVGGEAESELLEEAESDHFGFGREVDFGMKNITSDNDDSVFVTGTFVMVENVVDFIKNFLVFSVTDGFSNVDVGKVVDTDVGIFFLHLFFKFKNFIFISFLFSLFEEMKKK